MKKYYYFIMLIFCSGFSRAEFDINKNGFYWNYSSTGIGGGGNSIYESFNFYFQTSPGEAMISTYIPTNADLQPGCNMSIEVQACEVGRDCYVMEPNYSVPNYIKNNSKLVYAGPDSNDSCSVLAPKFGLSIGRIPFGSWGEATFYRPNGQGINSLQTRITICLNNNCVTSEGGKDVIIVPPRVLCEATGIPSIISHGIVNSTSINGNTSGFDAIISCINGNANVSVGVGGDTNNQGFILPSTSGSDSNINTRIRVCLDDVCSGELGPTSGSVSGVIPAGGSSNLKVKSTLQSSGSSAAGNYSGSIILYINYT